MVRRYYTFLIFPGAHGKLRQIQLPSYFVQLILGFALAGVMTLAVLANSYAHMLLKIADFNTLRTEREALKTHCHTLESIEHVPPPALNPVQMVGRWLIFPGWADCYFVHSAAPALYPASRGPLAQ